MNSEFDLWLLAVGLALGAGLTWLAIGRLARSDEDVAAAERASEARWISDTIERWGGYAPAELVAQVLQLHRAHLRGAEGAPGPEALLEDEAAGAPEGAPRAAGGGGQEAAAGPGPAAEPGPGAEPGERPA